MIPFEETVPGYRDHQIQSLPATTPPFGLNVTARKWEFIAASQCTMCPPGGD